MQLKSSPEAVVNTDNPIADLAATRLVGDERNFLEEHYYLWQPEQGGRRSPITGTRALALGVGAWWAMSTARFVAEDSSNLSLVEKAARAALNVWVTTLQQQPITSEDPRIILLGGATAVAGGVGGFFLLERGIRTWERRGVRQNETRRRTRERLILGNIEGVTFSNHTIVVAPSGHKLLKELSDVFGTKVLISEEWNSYDHLYPGEATPRYPVWINGRSYDDETLKRANVLDAARLIFFTQPGENAIFIKNEDRTRVEDNLRAALETIVTAYNLRRANNILTASDFDAIVVAPRDFILPSSPIEALLDRAEVQIGIFDYLTQSGLPIEFILKHVHIIDPRDIIADKLRKAELKDKVWAFSTDPAFRESVMSFLTSYGFSLAESLDQATAIFTYFENDLKVITDPVIIRAAMRWGEKVGVIYQRTEGQPVEDREAKEVFLNEPIPVTPIDAFEQMDEVHHAFPLDFERGLRQELEKLIPKSEEEASVDLEGGHPGNKFLEILKRYHSRLPITKGIPDDRLVNWRVDFQYVPSLASMADQLRFIEAGGRFERIVRRKHLNKYLGEPAYIVIEDTGEYQGEEILKLQKTGRKVYGRQQRIYILILDKATGGLKKVFTGSRRAEKDQTEGHLNERDIGQIPWQIKHGDSTKNWPSVERALERLIGTEDKPGLLKVGTMMISE